MWGKLREDEGYFNRFFVQVPFGIDSQILSSVSDDKNVLLLVQGKIRELFLQKVKEKPSVLRKLLRGTIKTRTGSNLAVVLAGV